MRNPPSFRFGETTTCPQCGVAFPFAHARQRFCSRACALTAKAARPRKSTYRPEYHRAYQEKNRERVKRNRREHYHANRAEYAEKQKAYLQALPTDVRAERKARYTANHKDREKRRYHVTRAWLPWLNAFRGSKARATKHGVPFTITKEWCVERWTGRCEVTDIEFVLSTKRSPYLFSPSLDRIIPTLGYAPENTRFVLHAVNVLKGQGTDEDMLRIAQALVKRQKAGDPILYTHAPDDDFAVTMS